MDPLGVASTVTSLVTVGLQLSRKLSQLAGTSRDIHLLENDTLKLSLLLVQLQNKLLETGQPDGNALELESHLNVCSSLLKDVEALCAYQTRNAFLRRFSWGKSSASIAKAKPIAEQISKCSYKLIRIAKLTSVDTKQYHQSSENSLAPIAHHKVNLDRRLEVLQWLSPVDPLDRHYELQNNRVPATHSFLLDSPEFMEWFQGADNLPAEVSQNYDTDQDSEAESRAHPRDRTRLLWLHDKPGSGKTVLASFIIDHIRGRLRNNYAIAFYYFDYRFQQDLSYVLGSLLRQLCLSKNRVPDSVQRLFDAVADVEGENGDQIPSLFSSTSGLDALTQQQHQQVDPPSMADRDIRIKSSRPLDRIEGREQRPPLAEFVKALQSLCLEFQRCFIVIDAIDEHDSFGRRGMLQLLEGLRGCSCRVLLTSREDANQISTVFASHYTSILISPQKEDVDTYISDCLNRSMALNNMDEQKEKIRNHILDRSMDDSSRYNFLPAKLHIDWILEQLAINLPIDKALQNLPYHLPVAMSDQIPQDVDLSVKNLSETEQNLATFARLWILHAKRPLSKLELCHACATSDYQLNGQTKTVPTFESIERACTGYIAVDGITSTVSFVHYSVFQYYKHNRSKFHPQGLRQVALACLRYLKLDVINSAHQITDAADIDMQDYPFLNYIMTTWSEHCVERYFDDVDYLNTLTNEQREEYETRKEDLNNEILKLTLELFQDPMKRFPHLEALFQAAEGEDALGEPRFNSELLPACHIAAKYGLVEETKALLVEDISLLSGTSPSGATPLHYAAFEGHLSTVHQLLSYKGGEFDDVSLALDKNGMAALHCAAYRGHTVVIRALLEKMGDDRVDFSHPKIRVSPLMIAASTGRVNSIKTLFKFGAKVTLSNHSGQTALHLAAIGGSEAVVKLLLNHGAGVNDRDHKNRIPLHYAAMRSKYAVVELLLSNKSELDAKAYIEPGVVDVDSVETPLSFAIRNNNFDMTDLLLLKGADIHTPKISGQSLISYAKAMEMTAILNRLEQYSRINDSARRRPRGRSLKKSDADPVKTAPGVDNLMFATAL